MKLAVHVVTALALLGFATPALACPSMKTTQAEAQQPSATKEKEPIAKAEKGSKAQKTKDAQPQKSAPTSAN